MKYSVDRFEIYTFLFIIYTIRLEIRLEIRHRGVMSLCTTEDKTAVVVVAVFQEIPFVSRPWIIHTNLSSSVCSVTRATAQLSCKLLYGIVTRFIFLLLTIKPTRGLHSMNIRVGGAAGAPKS